KSSFRENERRNLADVSCPRSSRSQHEVPPADPVQRDDRPGDEQEGELACLVAEELHGEQRARPAADELEQVQRVLAHAPLAAPRTPLVDPVRDERDDARDGVDDEDGLPAHRAPRNSSCAVRRAAAQKQSATRSSRPLHSSICRSRSQGYSIATSWITPSAPRVARRRGCTKPVYAGRSSLLKRATISSRSSGSKAIPCSSNRRRAAE